MALQIHDVLPLHNTLPTQDALSLTNAWSTFWFQAGMPGKPVEPTWPKTSDSRMWAHLVEPDFTHMRSLEDIWDAQWHQNQDAWRNGDQYLRLFTRPAMPDTTQIVRAFQDAVLMAYQEAFQDLLQVCRETGMRPNDGPFRQSAYWKGPLVFTVGTVLNTPPAAQTVTQSLSDHIVADPSLPQDEVRLQNDSGGTMPWIRGVGRRKREGG